MSYTNPAVPQLDNPEVQHQLAVELPVRGALGEIVCPDVASLGVLIGSISAERNRWLEPVLTVVSSDWTLGAVAAGTVLADSGALSAGIYDVQAWGYSEDNSPYRLELQQRDAANAVTKAQVPLALENRGSMGHVRLALTLLEGERLRIVTAGGIGAGSYIIGTVGYSRRA